MRIEILTPDKNLFSGEVSEVYLPGTSGQMGVLNHHAAMITTLSAGEIRIVHENGKQSFQVNGGTVEVLHNKVIILAE